MQLPDHAAVLFILKDKVRTEYTRGLLHLAFLGIWGAFPDVEFHQHMLQL